MSKIIIVYGLIAGAILAGMIFLMMAIVGDSSDFERGESVGYISMAMAFSMIFFGIRSHRDKNLQGVISFNLAFRIGILITLIASICYILAWLTYFNFVDSTFIERYSEFFTNKLQSSGKPQEEITKELKAFHENMENYKSPGVMAVFTVLEVFPMGLIITILCSMLMKKAAPAPPVVNES